MSSCQLCASEVSESILKPSCGSCHSRVCNDCFNNWYSQVEIGKIVAHGHTICPFCKSNPKYALVKHLTLAHLRNVRLTKRNKVELCEWNYQMIYASCRLCLKVLPAMQRDCAQDALEINN